MLRNEVSFPHLNNARSAMSYFRHKINTLIDRMNYLQQYKNWNSFILTCLLKAEREKLVVTHRQSNNNNNNVCSRNRYYIFFLFCGRASISARTFRYIKKIISQRQSEVFHHLIATKQILKKLIMKVSRAIAERKSNTGINRCLFSFDFFFK